MAEYHGNDGVLTINSVALTDRVISFQIIETAEDIITSGQGDDNNTRTGGMKDGTLTVRFKQDQASSETYATLQPLIGTVTTFEGKATSAATGADNRAVSGSVFISEFSHMNLEPGSIDTFDVTWPLSGALTVATS